MRRSLKMSAVLLAMLAVISCNAQRDSTMDVNPVEKKDSAIPEPPPAGRPTDIPEGTKIFTFVEQSPQFPGGDQEMMKFLQKHVTYPDFERILDI